MPLRIITWSGDVARCSNCDERFTDRDRAIEHLCPPPKGSRPLVVAVGSERELGWHELYQEDKE